MWLFAACKLCNTLILQINWCWLQVDVPDEVPDFAMERCWEALKQRWKQLDSSAGEHLYRLAPRSPAMLVYMMEDWVDRGTPQDVQTFYLSHVTNKLLMEVGTTGAIYQWEGWAA